MKCKYCNSECIKKGQRAGIQRYQCKNCNKYQQESYHKPIIAEEKYQWTKRLNNEGCGISSISRLLKISKSSVQRLIQRLSIRIIKPDHSEYMHKYEIDEIKTFCGNKKNECWIMYALDSSNGAIVDFCVGRRTKENLSKITNTVLALTPKRVYTDRLNIYPTLIPQKIHNVFKYCTNKIERNNLTIRTRLKRLSRKTICFTKNTQMLYDSLKLFFWSIA